MHQEGVFEIFVINARICQTNLGPVNQSIRKIAN